MRPLLIILFFLINIITIGFSQSTILSFYHTADSIGSFPLPIDQYEIKTQKKLMDRYVTFIGKKKEKTICIAAVTLAPIKNLQKELDLTVEFHGPKPYIGEVTTWGYIFDRNGDGKIDYLALVSGAAAVEDSTITDDFPGFGSPMNKKQFGQYIGHCQILFNHWADDNFDGTIDAVVHYDMDPIRNWMKRHLVIRSTAFDGNFDDVWAFRGKITSTHEITPFTKTEVPFYELGSNESTFTKKMMDQTSGILQLINRAAALLKIGADRFRLR